MDWGIILLAVYIVSEWNFFRVDLMAAEDNLLGEEALPVKRVDVVKIVEASASSCKVEASGTDGAGGDAPSPTSAPSSGCATVTSAASLLTGLALLLGLGRRRPD